MNAEDDDLPVLTHILRTGNAGPGESPTPLPPVAARTMDALDPRSVVEAPLLTDQLVIGHEPQRGIHALMAPSFAPSFAPSSDLAPSFDVAPMFDVDAHDPHDPHHPHAEAHPADAFVLSQDHDAPQALGVAYDEPEYSTEPPTETPRQNGAELAERVKEAVLQTLSARIDIELDARIAQAIHVEVETALAQLQATLRTHLTDAMKDVVGRAVDEEIARLSAPRSDQGA